MTANLPTVLPATLPAKLALYKWIAYPNYENSNEKKSIPSRCLELYQQDLSTGLKKIGICIFIALFSHLFRMIEISGFFSLILVTVANIAFFLMPIFIVVFIATRLEVIWRGITKTQYNYKASTFIEKTRTEHTCAILVTLQKKYFKDCAWFRYGYGGLIYGNKVFAYTNVNDGRLIVFDKKDIKEVIMERVYTGSTTIEKSTTTTNGRIKLKENLIFNGYSGKMTGTSTTDSKSETTAHYEWHLDIIIGDMDYPKLSFVVDDTEWWTDTISKAYAVLKP